MRDMLSTMQKHWEELSSQEAGREDQATAEAREYII